MERNKRYQFCLNTANNCFLCFGEIIIHNSNEIKYSSIHNIFRYLKISLNEFNSLSKKSLEILNKTEVRVKLCGECELILESFSKHFKTLELARMRMEHELNKIQSRLKISEILSNEIEAQKHLKLVEEFRTRLEEKCEFKTSRVLPRVALVRKEMSSETTPLSQEISSQVDKQKSPSSNPISDEPPPNEVKDFKVDLNHLKVEESQEDPLALFNDEFDDIPEAVPPIQDPIVKSTDKLSPQKRKCSICGKILSWRALARHEARHNSVKKFSCESCGKAFHDKCDLTRHVRSHTGEKPHKCPHCPNRFGNKGNLHQHVRDVHNKVSTKFGIKRFRCKHCRRIFKHKRDIRKHLQGMGCRGLYALAPVNLPDSIEINVKINSTDK